MGVNGAAGGGIITLAGIPEATGVPLPDGPGVAADGEEDDDEGDGSSSLEFSWASNSLFLNNSIVSRESFRRFFKSSISFLTTERAELMDCTELFFFPSTVEEA